jgi:hypothetical membrane protein
MVAKALLPLFVAGAMLPGRIDIGLEGARRLVLTGYLAPMVYWAFTLASMLRNPWFSLSSMALSDLGGPMAADAWIYNSGLVLSGVLVILYSIALLLLARGKLQVIGGSYLSIAGLFLAMIGIFPAGTRPHVFVSTYFFVQAFLGVLVLGLAELKENRRVALSLIAIFLLSLLGSVARWTSVALQEVYEISLLTAFVVVYNAQLLRR